MMRKILTAFFAAALSGCGHTYQAPYQMWQPAGEPAWRITGKVYDTPRPPAVANIPGLGNAVVPHPWQLTISIDGEPVIHEGLGRSRTGEFIATYRGRQVATLCSPEGARITKCDVLVDNQRAAAFAF